MAQGYYRRRVGEANAQTADDVRKYPCKQWVNYEEQEKEVCVDHWLGH